MERFNIYREDGHDYITRLLVKEIGTLRFKGKQHRELFKKHGIKFKARGQYMIISVEYFIRRVLMTNYISCIMDMINLVDNPLDANDMILLACRYSNVEVINCLLANGMELMYPISPSMFGCNGLDFVTEREDDNIEIAEKVIGDNDIGFGNVVTAARCNNIKIFKFLHQKALANGARYNASLLGEIVRYRLVEIFDYLITENYFADDNIVKLIDNDVKCFEEVIKNRIDDGHLQFSDNQLLLLRQFIDV
jgi:hypothetical protein